MKWTCKKLCRQYNTCLEPCDIIEGQLKDKGLRELLPPPDITSINRIDTSSNPPHSIGYKDVLQANIEARRDYIPTTIKEVRSIHDKLQRAVAAMLYAELPITDIAIIIDKSTRTVRRICKR